MRHLNHLQMTRGDLDNPRYAEGSGQITPIWLRAWVFFLFFILKNYYLDFLIKF